MAGYVAEIVARKREQPGKNLISGLIADQGGDRLNEAEVLRSIRLLVIAGHETAVDLLSNRLLALLRNPDQLALLLGRPELTPDAVEEMLRYDGPVERSTTRFAVQDVQVGGTLLRRLPGLELDMAPEDLVYEPSVIMRGVATRSQPS